MFDIHDIPSRTISNIYNQYLPFIEILLERDAFVLAIAESEVHVLCDRRMSNLSFRNTTRWEHLRRH